METEEVETEKEKTIWRIFAKRENKEMKQQLLGDGELREHFVLLCLYVGCYLNMLYDDGMTKWRQNTDNAGQNEITGAKPFCR